MSKVCFGCGVKLQCDDINKEGYIPKEKIDNSIYCQRCYRIMHYGVNKVENTPKSVDNIINNINKNRKFGLFITDLININKELIKIYHRIKGPKLLIINKSDLIDQSIRFDKIISNLKDIYSIKEDIMIISSNSGYGIKNLINYLLDNKIKEVYLLGETNAGKSSLINKMIDILNSNVNKITTSNFSNTTLDFLRIKLSDELVVIDSPGFFIEEKDASNKLINPKIYQMKANEIIKIDNYYIEFNSNTPIVIYLNKEVKINKYFKDIDLNNKIPLDYDSDLIIKGLGFIHIKNKGEIKINTLDKIEVRKSVLKDYE